MIEAGANANALLTRRLVASFPVDAARALERMPARDIAQLLASEDATAAAQVIRALAIPVARDTFVAMDPGRASAIAAVLPVPWAASMLRTMPPAQLEEILKELPNGFASAVRRALQHSSQTVASLMNPLVLSLPADVDVAFAIEQLRARKETTLECIYVVARDGLLAGAVRIPALVTASPETLLSDLLDAQVPALDADTDAPSLAAHSGWAHWRSLPVVDAGNHFLGAVSYHVIQRLLLDIPATSAKLAPLHVSFAELFWLGLTGMTDGLARTVASQVAQASDEQERLLARSDAPRASDAAKEGER